MKESSGLFTLVAVTISLLATVKLSGQSSPADSTPTFRTTTRLVSVDVVATDSKGHPVTDLKQPDFTVKEEGNQEELRVFSFQQPAASSTVKASAQPEPPANVFGNLRRTRITGPLNVLLLDGINTRMNNQDFVKSQVLEFLKKVPADQPLAIYLLGQKLQLLQDFTSDPEVLKKVIEQFKAPHSPLMDNAAGGIQRFWLEGVPLPPNLKRQVLEFQQQTESAQMDQRVSLTVAAFRTLAHTLAGYPGRKNLIWVSEAFPITLIPTKIMFGESGARATRFYNNPAVEIANLLADAHIAVYPVDARALVHTYAYDPSVRFDPRGNGVSPGQAASDLQDELQPVHAAMEQMAEDTGGRASYNRNDIDDAIRQDMNDGSTYYTLGYYPQKKNWDGKFRKISVQVNRRGVKLRYRLGYFAMDPAKGSLPDKQREMEFSDNLSPDQPAATQMIFEAAISPPSEKTSNKVAVFFAVDPQTVTFIQEDNGNQKARLQCAARIFTSAQDNHPLKTEAEDVDADLSPENMARVARSGVPCRASFDLPPGEYFIRLGIRDLQSGRIGTANAYLKVPALKQQERERTQH
ncbi:MAG TPA: VWA domain-containing protein [Candidatus Limnocylindrales bacterium]|nr:VWA domain-containing protein [Candidatus Limnocylindrales bacterium]